MCVQACLIDSYVLFICFVSSVSKECNEKLIVVCVWFRCGKKKLKLYEKNDSKEEEKKQDKWKTKHFNICIIWTLINLNTIMWIIFERWSWAYTITFRYDDAVAHVFIKEYKNTPTKRSYIPSVYFSVCWFVCAVFQ